MTKMDWTDWEEVKRLDLRRACFHEVGHMMVARHYGIEAWITIAPNPGGSTWESYEKAFAGQCHFGYSFFSATKYQFAVIGRAGPIADARAGGNGDYADGSCYDFDELSTTDQDFIEGHKSLQRTFDRALLLVDRHWSEIEREASEIVVAAQRKHL